MAEASKAKGCKRCCYTESVPLNIESTGCSDFVECPWCCNHKEFKQRTGWTIDKDGEIQKGQHNAR